MSWPARQREGWDQLWPTWDDLWPAMLGGLLGLMFALAFFWFLLALG